MQACAAHLVKIPPLEHNNFGHWLFRIQMALDEKGCAQIIKASDLVKKEDQESIKQDATARNLIIQALPDKHLEYVKEAKTAYEMVESLRKIFERKSTVSVMYLKRKLINLKHKKSQNLEDHFANFDKIIREMEENDSKMQDKEKICQLLLSVEDAYQQIVTALESSDSKLSIDFVKSRLLDAELKEKNSSRQATSNSEYMFTTSDSKKCFSCGDPGHFVRNCPKKFNRGRGRNNNTRGRRTYQNKRQNFANLTEENCNESSFIAANKYKEKNNR